LGERDLGANPSGGIEEMTDGLQWYSWFRH